MGEGVLELRFGANVGDVPDERSLADMAETFRRTDSLNSADVGNANDCYENAADEQKISISESGNVVSSAKKVVNVGKDEKRSTDSITNGQVSEKLRRAIDIVVGYSRVSDETKERLKSAVTDEACQCYKLAVSYFRTYYNMVKKLLNRANLIKEHNGGIISTAEDRGIEINVKNERTEMSCITSNHESNAADDNQAKDERKTWKVRRLRKNYTQDISAIDKKRVDKCIHDCCGTSGRHSTKADAIRKAVGMVLHGGCTGVDAARATNLTPRTVMKHVYTVRDALNLPHYRKSKQQEARRKEKNEMKEESFLEKVTDNDREIVKVLIDEKFECVEAKDFSGTGLELESKIDKLLREFNCNGDVKKIREAVIRIFKEQKPEEPYKAIAGLPVTIITSYVRLLKAFLWAENMMKASYTTVTIPRRGRRRMFDNRERSIRSAEPVKHIKSPETDRIFSAKKKRKLTNSIPRGVFIGKIDVLTLHLENGAEDEEQLIKSVISYLIDHQYRRSETAQTNMQICLEHILLDGLSVPETLKIHDGPNESILEIYHKRCRDAYTALTVDFPTFVLELNLLSEGNKNKSRRKRSNIANVKVEEMKPIYAMDMGKVDVLKFDTVEKLFISIPEKAKALLHSYVMKLLNINFPLEKRLVSGLLQMIGEKIAKKYMLDDKLLEDCVAYFYEKHNSIVT
ncbi:unnamed protein product [Litomosoides sigmodontis]|uniref:Uncharacterized protein n=1 Tax=Litomosoides sigmodontis TaxID=42156 RepID=A0A3P6UN95_LITSI|nr:unnamed protein product [Litomosoides sigmodontis]